MPRVHPHLTTSITFPMADQQTASALVQVGLSEHERLMDPQTGSPQHNNQTPHPPPVTAVSGLAHDRNDLVNRGRICRIPPALVRWDPPDVMAGHRRRRSGRPAASNNW